MLEELLERYYKLMEEEESVKAAKDALKAEITEIMDKDNLTKYESENGYSAALVEKETFKYDDELSMIKWLKENGYTSFIKEKIDTTSMNKELKKTTVLTESLHPMYTKTVSKSLTVKKA